MMGKLFSLDLQAAIDWLLSSLPFAGATSDNQQSDTPGAIANDAASTTPQAPDANSLPQNDVANIKSVVPTHDGAAGSRNAAADTTVTDEVLHHQQQHHQNTADASSIAPANEGVHLLAPEAATDSFATLNPALETSPAWNGTTTFTLGTFGGSIAPVNFADFAAHSIYQSSSGHTPVLVDPSEPSIVLSSLGGGGAAPNGSAPLASGSSSTGLIINVVYDSSVSSAPSGFTAVIQQVVNYFETHFTNPISITINVGFGEIGGGSLPSNALGASETYIESAFYSDLKSALLTAGTPGATTLPSTGPTGGTYWVSTAEARALGLDPSYPGIDGYVGFGNSAGLFDYDNTNGVSGGSYDFYGVVAHEFTEVMGRMLFVGTTVANTAHSYGALDLFHFSGSGTRDFFQSTPDYFSVASGATNIDSFNTDAGGDAAACALA